MLHTTMKSIIMRITLSFKDGSEKGHRTHSLYLKKIIV